MNKVLDGMNIIAKYDEDAMTSIEGDFLFFGDSNLLILDEDVKKLHELGWTEEGYYSWMYDTRRYR